MEKDILFHFSLKGLLQSYR